MDKIDSGLLDQATSGAGAPGPASEAEALWKAYSLPEAGSGRRVRFNSAGIGALARQLKAAEWARALGRGPRHGFNLGHGPKPPVWHEIRRA